MSLSKPCPVRLLAVVSLLAGAGCISAPTVILVDQKTALEQQAAGEFRALEVELDQAGTTPKAENIPGSALAAGPQDSGGGRLGEVAKLYSVERTDAQRIDRLLVDHCIGEALDGSLLQTPERCKADVDTAQVTRLVERANLHRRQIWNLLRKQAPGASEEQVRQAWRARHLERVVCAGQVQVGELAWEGKKC